MDEDATQVTVVIQIVDPEKSPAHVEALVGSKDSGSKNWWTHALTAQRSIDLDRQLLVAKKFVENKKQVLEEMKGSEISLRIAWVPREPQDGIVIGLDFLDLLATVRCSVTLDTFVRGPVHEGGP